MEIIVNSRIITLGESISNTKEYLLKSSIKLSDKFVSFPFGITKVRFQFEELFNFVMKEIDETKYKLIVTKKPINNKNCPHNPSFFNENGWKLNLKILNIVDYTTNNLPLTLEEINKSLPENYGNVELFRSEQKNNTKIGIVVPIFSRHKYLETFFQSINQTDMKNCLLLLIDESMTKDVDDDKIKVRELVKNFKNNCCDVIKIYKNVHGNMFDSILTGFDLLVPYCEHAMTIDSDTIHEPNWINKCIETYEKATLDNPNNIVLLSGFNTINSGKHMVMKECNDYVVKHSVGGCHMMFDRETYYSNIRKALTSTKWDTNILTAINFSDNVVVVTKPSVIEHIGFESSVRDDTKYDKSVDYI